MRISRYTLRLRRSVSAALVPLLILAAPVATAARRGTAAPVLPGEATLALPSSVVLAASFTPRGTSPASYTEESTHALRLQHAAFPRSSAPGALVFIPAGVDRSRPLDVVIFFHGYNGCAAAVASPEPIPCHPGGPRRGALDLIGQFRASGRAAVLIIPQLALESQLGAPGQLGLRGGLRRMLQETLDALASQLGAQAVDALGSVRVMAHSGGYEAALAVLHRGEVEVQQVAFFDALYTGIPTLSAWLVPGLRDPFLGRRFVSVFREGAAAAGSRQLDRVLRAQGFGGYVRRRSVPGRVTEEEARAPVALLQADGDHQQVLRRNLAAVLRGSGLAELRR